MAQEYYHESNLTTPSETDIEDEESLTTSDSEASAGSELSSGGLTRTSTIDSYENLSSRSGSHDSSMNTLSNLLGRNSLGGPRVLNDGAQHDSANVETPVLSYTLEEAKAIIKAQEAADKKDDIYKRINDVVSANSLINTDRRGVGFKFVSLCICAAFGGRRGVDRYDRNNAYLSIKTVIPQLNNLSNHSGGLNITMMCYIGHIILYYWGDEDVRNALVKRFGPLDRVVGSKSNIRSEIGAKNLWAPKVVHGQSRLKRQIIGEYEDRFAFDVKEFESIMLKMGIDLT